MQRSQRTDKTVYTIAGKKMQVVVDFKTKKRRREHRLKIWCFGLRKERGTLRYTGNISERKYKRLANYCTKYRLHYYINNRFGRRSSNYRSKFFKSHSPILGHFYICVYCGRILTKSNTAVDHLYPVSSTEKSISMQRKLKRHGYSSVNDERNLVPSCRRCNLRKGSKTGLWTLRGKLGTYTILWFTRYALRVAIGYVLISWIYKYLLTIITSVYMELMK